MKSSFARGFALILIATLWCGCPQRDLPGEDDTILIVDLEDAGSRDATRDEPDVTPEAPDTPRDMPVVDAAPDLPQPLEDMEAPEDTSPDLEDMPQDMTTSPIEAGPLTVASFNVELFFDTVCDTGDCGENSFERLPSAMELAERYMITGAGIDRLGADVLVLQEIEKEDVFETLLMSTQQNYTAMVFGETGREGSIDVAVAARGELLEVTRHRRDELVLPDGSRSRFARELLEVHLRMRGARVIVFGAHYISKFNPSNDDRRTAEAARTAELALAARVRYPDALIIVAGDLNDTPDSEPLAEFTRAGLTLTSQGRALEDVYTNVFGFTLQIIDHIIYLETPGVSFDASSGLEVLRDDGQRGLSGSDHAAPRATFVFD